jgi:hypothetical protein
MLYQLSYSREATKIAREWGPINGAHSPATAYLRV